MPREKSHYEVNFCCTVEQAGSVAASVYPYKKIAAYHGEIAVDPATGDIRRLQLEADLKTGEPVVSAGILVEYAPVEIGGRTYICPVHSVSRSLAQTVQVNERYHYALANEVQPLKNSLNDVRFTEYHVFRGDARLLAEAVPEPTTEPASSATSIPPSSAAPAPTAPASAQAPVAADEALPSAAHANPTAGELAANSANTPPVPPAAPIEKPAPEMSESADATIPGAPVDSRNAETGFTLRSTSRLVDVAVVAFDKKGRPAGRY